MAEELFEVCDETGRLLGLERRSVVHSRGLWHRAANVFLFRSDGRLVLQRRQITKDVCPGAWDVSVGEHLVPGEDYEAGALRGLREELGVTGVAVAPLGAWVRRRLDLPALGIKDYEIQQSFRAEWDGALTPDPNEVAEVRLCTLADLALELAAEPETFTPWLRERARELLGLGTHRIR